MKKEENKQAPETTPLVRETIYLKLKAPFPDAAYGADITRSEKVLTSLKAHYVVERLNDVFGIGNWRLDGEWKDVDDGILFIGELTCQFTEDDKLVTISTGPVPGFGGVDHANSGDAYKSARTDCLSKSASLLGVGNEMYKGNVEPRLSDAQKKALDVEEEPQKEATSPEEEVEKEEKPKRKGFGPQGRKAATEEKEDDARKLRPGRQFYRGSRLKPKNESRENEDGSASESTDNAAQ
jgi:hypothetical protein